MKSFRFAVIIIGLILLIFSVNAVVPNANFTSDVVTGVAPLNVGFIDDSTGTPTGWAWFFGDEAYNQAWTLVNTNPGWSGRYLHSATTLNNGSIVIMGGSTGFLANDTWISINGGSTWTQQNASSGWAARWHHSTVTLPDNSIILTGGMDSGNVYNDTWRSTDGGATWVLQTASSGWSERIGHTTIALSNGDLILMGGNTLSGRVNDVWKSTDDGATWTQINASAGWGARYRHTSVLLQNGSILILGGYSNFGGVFYNDVWESTDSGVTWFGKNASAGWSPRNGHNTVVMPDQSVILIGGYTGVDSSDMWRSTDNGTTWNQINASSQWGALDSPKCIAIQDGSIILTGGFSSGTYYDNVWKFNPVGSSAQHPSHVFLSGYHTISMQASNSDGYDSIQSPNYLYVTGLMSAFNATPMAVQIGSPISFVDMSGNGPTIWCWTFGDGNSSASRNVSYTYPTVGTFTVSLNVSNVGAYSNTSQNVTVYPAPPLANFSVNPSIGSNPLTVTFSDTSTGSDITSWSWTFGDGGTDTVQNPVHTYSTLGTYYAQLTISNSVGTNISQPVIIYVTPTSIPMVDFIGYPVSGSAPLNVQFTDLSVALNPMSGWNWSFGDGTYSNAFNPMHSYASNGQYSVTLVAASGVFTNYTTKVGYINVGVLPNMASANFIANTTYALYPATIQFYDQSMCNPACTNWQWDFNNDGSPDSSERNPIYVYTYPGNYSPKLIVSNGANSGTKVRVNYILIGPVLVQPTITQPTAQWVPGYQANGTIYAFRGNANMDMANSTYLKYWLQNFSATGNFSVYGFATGLMAPIMHVFGFWIFLIIWLLYLFAVWVRSQDVTMPLIIGILSIGTFGLLFPKEALPVIIIMFVICGAIIITKVLKE